MNHHAPDFKIVGVVNLEYGIFLIILMLPIRFLIILKNHCKDNNNSAFIATFVLRFKCIWLMDMEENEVKGRKVAIDIVKANI